MDKKSLLAIHKVMAILVELHILTEGKDADYFYERMEMTALLELIDELERCLLEVNGKVKDKYHEVDWNLVKKARYYDEAFGKSTKLGDAWEIASGAYGVLYNNMLLILKSELADYYHERCVKQHEEYRKSKLKNALNTISS